MAKQRRKPKPHKFGVLRIPRGTRVVSFSCDDWYSEDMRWLGTTECPVSEPIPPDVARKKETA